MRMEGGGISGTEASRPSICAGEKTTAERSNRLDCERLWSCTCCFFLFQSQIRLHQSGSRLIPLSCSPNFSLALQGSELITEARLSHLFPSPDLSIDALFPSSSLCTPVRKDLASTLPEGEGFTREGSTASTTCHGLPGCRQTSKAIYCCGRCNQLFATVLHADRIPAAGVGSQNGSCPFSSPVMVIGRVYRVGDA